jgi:hypothetical protein
MLASSPNCSPVALLLRYYSFFSVNIKHNKNIVEDIKIRRLGWAGHIVRMEEGRIPKKVLNGKFHNTRPVGRPRIRWEDAVQKNALQISETRGWRRKAENREE